MPRYIDADALKEKFTSKWILDRIDQHPTADVVERKQGKWIDYEDVENSIYGHVSCRCSICGHVSQYEENYCMHCGADMRGEEGERNI